MNVRKRGLALLMCICMIFTLLPFSVFAEDPTPGIVGGGQSDPVSGTVYYGTNEDSGWSRNSDSASVTKNYSENNNNITYSKTAEPVNDSENTYQVTLKIVSKTTTTSPDASAVVLVIDTSSSMKQCEECGQREKHANKCTHYKSGRDQDNEVQTSQTRLYAAKKAAKSFAESYAATDSDRYLAVVTFNSSAAYLDFSYNNSKVYWLDVTDNSNLQTVKNKIDAFTTSQGTNLAGGLTNANNLFTDNTLNSAVSSISAEYKFAVVLTDGEPTSSNADNKKAADALKDTATVYTVGCGLTDDSAKKLLKNTVASKLENAFEANDAEELNKAFTDIFTDIVEGLNSGFTVIDPMGANVNMSATQTWPTGATYNETTKTLTWMPVTETSKSGPDKEGHTTYTYTLTYTVTLDTDELDKGDDGYVPLNGTTTLQFTDNKQTQTCYFNVPAVYYKVPTYTVTYQWSGTAPAGVNAPTDEESPYRAGAHVRVKSVIAPAGWTFKGWTTNDVTLEDNQFTMPAKEVTLTGSWTQNEYTVTYKQGEHGTLTENKVAEVATTGLHYGDKTPDAPTVNAADGWYFTGWDTEPAATVTDNAEYTAQYAEKKTITVTAKSETATYNGEEHSASGLVSDTFTIDGKTYTVSGLDATVTKTDAGTYDNVVTGTPVVRDEDNNNVTAQFTVNTKNGTLTINKAAVTVTAGTYEVAVGGEMPDLDKQTTVTGTYGTDEVTYKIIGAPADTNTADKYTLTPTGEPDQGNYTVTFKSGELTIYNVYTVIYEYECTDGSTDCNTLTPLVDGSNPYREGTTARVLANPTDTLTGYVFDGWYKDNTKVNALSEFKINANTRIIGKWKPVSGLTCTINYYWNGNKTTPLNSVTLDGLTYNQTLTKGPVAIPGYTPVSSDSKTITVKETGNVIDFYYYKNVTLESHSGNHVYDGNPYTVSGYDVITKTENGKNVKLTNVKFTGVTASRTETNAGSYDVNFIVDKTVVDENSLKNKVDTTECYIVTDAALGTLTITPKPVTVTANDKTKYVGQKDPEFTATVTGLIGNDTIRYELSREEGETAGKYTIYAKGNPEQNSNYAITFENGTLTINRRPYIPPTPAKKIIVTITGNTGSEVYDATEHNVKGYTWECTDPSYTEDDFEFTGTADAKGTYVGKYDMGIKPDQFKNLNSAYDVEFVVKTDGELDITKKPLTITAGSAEGYGPEAITCDTYTATELAKGDKLVSVKITGKQSVPGSSANVASDAVIQDASGKDVTANYEIKYVNGTLTMLEILNKEDHFNYVIGYPDGTVRPNANITRAEVATIFFRLLTDDGRKEFDTRTSTFSDVADGQWYTRAIATLANAKIVSGYPDGSFRPNDSITRAEMATIIARFANLSADGKTFNDISGHWAQKYIELAAGNGWINGYSDGSFGPDKKITRAETFAMINRVLDRQTESNDDLLPASQMLNWSDNANTTEWYYRDMQEATNNHKCERIGDSKYEKWTEKLPEIDWASYQI